MTQETGFCPNHLEKKIYSKGLCRKCYEKQLIKKNPEFKERQLLNSRKWNKKNPEKKSLYGKEYRLNHPVKKDYKYFQHTLKAHGLTKEEYDILLENCDNKCMLCFKNPYEGKRLHLDHCHKTGKVRGLLCPRCNWYLHTIEKDINILERIKNYLNIKNE